MDWLSGSCLGGVVTLTRRNCDEWGGDGREDRDAEGGVGGDAEGGAERVGKATMNLMQLVQVY